MKYSFLEKNDRNMLKKHLFEYDQFADDEEYDEEVDDYDPEVDKLLEYKLKNVDEFCSKFFDENSSETELMNVCKYNKDLINEKEKHGRYTPLMYAAQRLDIGRIKILLLNGADVNLSTSAGTALSIAGSNREIPDVSKIEERTDTVRLLLNNGADPNYVLENGYSILMMFAIRGFRDIVNILLEHGVNPNFQDQYGHTALMYCIYNEENEIIIDLLKNGADPDIKDDKQNTALCMAMKKGLVEIVKILLEYGANPNEKTTEEETPLIIAVKYGYIDIVKLLLEYGADAGIEDNSGETALYYSIRKNSNEEVEILLNNSSKDVIRYKDIMQSLYNENAEILDMLLSKNKEVLNEKQIYVILRRSILRAEYSIIEIILKHFKISEKYKKEIFEFSKESNDEEILKILKKYDITG